MKKIIILFLFFNLSAKENYQMFSDANKNFRIGNYNEAKKLYSKLIDFGFTNGEIYYNLGNTYYRINDFPRAILNYEKAKKYNFSDDELNHNLKLAKLKTVDRIEEIPKLFFIKWYFQLVDYLSINTLFWITIFLFNLILISILSLKYFVQFKTVLKPIIFVLVFLFSLTFLISFFSEINQSKHAIIIENTVAIKSSPDLNSKDLFIIHGGLKVELNDKVLNWYKIKLIDGKTGWIEINQLEVI